MIKKKLALTFAIVAAGAVSVLGTGTASAAHCTDNGGPGHSDFAAHARANGAGEHNEGDHRGWSSCR